MEVPEELTSEFRKTRELLESFSTANINCHRDADGLCGAAIIKQLLEKFGISCSIRSVLPNDLRVLEPSKGLDVFVDVGSGQLSHLQSFQQGALVVDHHPPQGRESDNLVHLNPNKIGFDGSTEVSGAGMAFLLSRSLGAGGGLAKLAVVGAIADRQDLLGDLRGLNAGILRIAVEEGSVKEEKDVLLFGKESRPLHLALKYFNDPPIPGVSGLEAGSMQLLADLDIPLREGKRFRTLHDLDKEERRRLASELVVRSIGSVSPNVSTYIPKMIIGSTYRMVGEDRPLQYAREFATCVNSAARMGLERDAVDMLVGDRSGSYQRVLEGLERYRKQLSVHIRRVVSSGIETAENGYLQYFKEPEVPRNIVGPVTGLVLGSGAADIRRPLVGLSPDEPTKASARCSKTLVLEGMDLSVCVERAAASVGGEGGGHRGAAGAFFRTGYEEVFLHNLEDLLLDQVRSRDIPVT